MGKEDIEVVCTSYNRWNLLEPCLETLFKTIGTDYKVTVVEDSVQEVMKERIIGKFGDKVNLIFNEKNIGQAASIDKGYNQVTSKYILKIEDDYLFNGNQDFIKRSIDVLENNPHIHNVWIRQLDNYVISHGRGYMDGLFEPAVLSTPSGTNFKMLKLNHYGPWTGFTFMPHVSRLEDYKMMFPNGYADCAKETVGVFAELACSEHAKNNFNMRAAQIIPGACATRHDQTTYSY